MKLPRRKFLHLAAGAAALPVSSRIARSQTYPARPVRWITGFSPGGVGDIIARLIAQWLSERLGQQFVVENQPGAGGNIATEAVVRAPADGYTLLLVVPPNAINATLYDKLNFNFIRDIAPVAGIASQPHIVVINSAVPAKTIPEFTAYAKANPGKIIMASGGSGTTSHLAGELFKSMTETNLVHVPYRGEAGALREVIGDQAQIYFGSVTASLEHIRAGKVRPLAVTTTMRSKALPDLSTVGDFVPGYEVSNWIGVGAPKDTPAEIIDRLNREINAGLADTKMVARFADFGSSVLSGSSAEFGKLIADETEKWGKVIRAAGVKAQ
jgi:tripartite-type tricarboxylate transporter receptor subunit TctC